MKAAALALIAGAWLAGQADACLFPPDSVALPGSVTVAPDARVAQPETYDPAAAITAVWYAGPTDIYLHGIMGSVEDAEDLLAYTASSRSSCGTLSVTAGANHVFEDTAPRLADLDGDGKPEIVAVRSHLQKGAQLAIYQDAGDGVSLKLIAATPYIGTRNRWLAPVGAADLDGDGYVELAYIDRPHLAKTLRVWRFRDGTLEPVADQVGLTNHRIGEEDIGGGIRDCGQGSEMITASGNWRDVMATVLVDGQLRSRAIGPYRDRRSFDAALSCS